MIIALVGMAGSGKSIVSSHLRTEGFPVIRFGKIIVNEVLRRGLALTPGAEQMVRTEIRSEYGMAACVRLSLPEIRNSLKDHDVVVIDGLYSFSEYRELRNEFGNALKVIAIFAPRELRYQRLAVRPERPLSREEAEARDYHEIERIEKGGPIAIADYLLLNDGTGTDLTKSVDELLRVILGQAGKE